MYVAEPNPRSRAIRKVLLAGFIVVSSVSIDATCAQSYVEGNSEMHRFYSGGKWGFVDRRGAVLVRPRFEWALDSHEGLAAVVDGDGTRGYIRRDGTRVAKLPSTALLSGSFSEGRAWFKQHVGDGNLYGCIAANGDIIIAPKYHSYEPFSEGLAVVEIRTRRNGREEYLYGYVNRSGKLAIPAEYLSASQFCKGRAFVAFDEHRQYKCIDRDGNRVFTIKVPHIDGAVRPILGPLLEGRSTISFMSRFRKGVGSTLLRHGLLTTNGRVIWLPKNRSVLGFRYSEGLAPFSETDAAVGTARFVRRKFGFVDVEGRIVIQPQFDKVGRFSEGLCRTLKDGVWRYIDRSGNVVLKGRRDDEWNDAEDFYDGLARVHVGGSLTVVGLGVARWWKGGTWYYINRRGNVVAKCRDDGDDYIAPGFGAEFQKTDPLVQ